MPILALIARRFLSIAFVAFATVSYAEKSYGPGVTDAEIKIGQTMPYSGPLSGYSTIATAEAAYFAKINAEGGINGRKINFSSLDDGLSPPKTVEQTRKLIEQEEVLLLFNSFGTSTNTAIRNYVNQKKVPHFFSNRRNQLGRPSEFSLDHGLAARVPDGSKVLREIYPADQARRQDRGALSKRL